MDEFKSKPMATKQDLLTWSGVPRSNFYYKRVDGIRGRKPSEMTHAQMIFNRYYDWYNIHRKYGAFGRKSPELYLRQNDLISGPYKTKRIPDISQILTPFCPKIKWSIHYYLKKLHLLFEIRLY